MKNITLTINSQQVTGPQGATILEIARMNNVSIPTLCHDDKLEPFGSCFLCICEVEGARRLMPACATKATEGMVVHTETPAISQNRKMCLELLLSDHVGDCLGPCTLECPGDLDPQGYIAHAAEGRYLEALKLIKSVLPMPASIGRVCPRPCEEKCRRNVLESPVAIDSIKRFIADWDLASDEPWKPSIEPSTGKNIAIIGAGPAGLTAAYYLTIKGHNCTIYEMKSKPGGMFRYGIPEYRLPYDVLDKEIETITRLGVHINYDTKLGTDITLSQLKTDNDAVLIATGAWKSSAMRCKGEDLEGVWGGIDYLIDVVEGKDVKTGRKALIVGGGNTAIDAARTAWRLGADVTILYRRTEKEMPAHVDEIAAVRHEEIDIQFLTAPVSIEKLNDGTLEMTVIKMELGEPDSSGRRRPVPIEGSEFKIQADTIISAIGQKVDNSWMSEEEESLKQTSWGSIAAENDGGITTVEGVFAAGDCASGADIAIKAIGSARKCANDIHCYVMGLEKPVHKNVYNHTRGSNESLSKEIYKDVDTIQREPLPEIPVEERRLNFKETELTYSTDQLIKECSRCLECGCQDLDECELRTHSTTYGLGANRFAGDLTPGELDYSHPFVLREPSKCIKCGRCIRACSDVQGIGAIGFVDRGFNATVQPTFGKPLEETECESCGQCVAACPTGALLERIPGDKCGPFHLVTADSVCTECGIGCSIMTGGTEQHLLKVTPAPMERGSNMGNLCQSGRFNRIFDEADKVPLTEPMIRKAGKLTPVSWDEAIDECQNILKEHSPEETALLVSPHLTCEAARKAATFARDVIKTSNIGSSRRPSSEYYKGLAVHCKNRGTFKLVRESDLVILLNSRDISKKVSGNHIIASLKEKGTLISIGKEADKLDNFPGVKILSEEDELTAVLKALKDMATTKKGTIVPGLNLDEVSILGDCMKDSRKPVIVANYDRHNITELSLVKDLSLALKAPIVFISDYANNEGHYIAGIDPVYGKNFQKRQHPGRYILEMIDDSSLKAAIILGEDPMSDEKLPNKIKESIGRLEDLIVADSYLSEVTHHCKVFLPTVPSFQMNGTFINCEGITQEVKPLSDASYGKPYEEVIELLSGRKLSGTKLP